MNYTKCFMAIYLIEKTKAGKEPEPEGLDLNYAVEEGLAENMIFGQRPRRKSFPLKGNTECKFLQVRA